MASTPPEMPNGPPPQPEPAEGDDYVVPPTPGSPTPPPADDI